MPKDIMNNIRPYMSPNTSDELIKTDPPVVTGKEVFEQSNVNEQKEDPLIDFSPLDAGKETVIVNAEPTENAEPKRSRNKKKAKLGPVAAPSGGK